MVNGVLSKWLVFLFEVDPRWKEEKRTVGVEHSGRTEGLGEAGSDYPSRASANGLYILGKSGDLRGWTCLTKDK